MSITIFRIRNSFGRGYEINSTLGGMCYYDYSKRESIRRYREQFNLKYKHIEIYDFA